MDEMEVSFQKSGAVTIPLRLRERHLTPEVDEAIVQATGLSLQVTIPSARDTLMLRFPLETWTAGRPYSRSIIRGAVDLDRWIESIETAQSDCNTDCATVQYTTIDLDP